MLSSPKGYAAGEYLFVLLRHVVYEPGMVQGMVVLAWSRRVGGRCGGVGLVRAGRLRPALVPAARGGSVVATSLCLLHDADLAGF